MASYIVHVAVAKELNKKLNRNENKLLLGSVAPDISKCIGEDRHISHFIDEEESNIPNIERFLSKYKYDLNDDFVMGYFIHIYTDYLWFKYFMSEIIKDGTITKLDGSVVKLNGDMALMYIYNDYTNLNIQIIEKYDLDLEGINNYKDIEIKHIINEIPYDKFNILFNNILDILINSKKRKEFVFNISNIDRFIDMSVELIYSEIEDLEKMIRLEESK